ncbi:sialate O-acetylesterase [Xanthobacter sp. KR7-225]|uniref:sialate O-acetylesterase n=1 Tax=Xanthobacter sp. KR7-225 TaxID=3156613 RepID=UPI0032B59C2B
MLSVGVHVSGLAVRGGAPPAPPPYEATLIASLTGIASDTLLSAYTPEVGPSMARFQPATWTNTITVQAATQMGVQSSTGYAAYCEGADQPSADCEVRARVRLTAMGSLDQRVVLGASPTDYQMYELSWYPHSGAFSISRRSTASSAVILLILSTFDKGCYLTVGETIELALTRTINADGNAVLTAYRDGRLLGQVVDADPAKITRAGRCGFVLRGGLCALQYVTAGPIGPAGFALSEPQLDRHYSLPEGLTHRTLSIGGPAIPRAGAVKARIINDRTKAIVESEITVDPTPTSTFAGSVSLPAGVYRIEIWQAGNPWLVLKRRFAVSIENILVVGQSNGLALYWTDAIPATDRPFAKVISDQPQRQYSTPNLGWNGGLVGAGAARFFRTAEAESGTLPMGLLGFAIGATTLASWQVGGSSWASFIDPIHGFLQPQVAAEATMAIWNQGEAEYGPGTSKAACVAYIRAIFAEIRALAGRPNLPIIIVQTGRNLYPGGGNADNVRAAELIVADDPNVYLVSAIDLGLRDTAHYDAAGNDSLADRLLQARRYFRSGATWSGKGPQIIGATAIAGGNEIRLTVATEGGFGLVGSGADTAGAALTGLVADYSGAAQAIAATAIVGNEIVLTVPTVPSSGVSIGHALGQNPVVSGICRDTSPLGLPLLATGGLMPVEIH